MSGIDEKKVNDILDRVIQYELSGIVRFTHYALMVTGPNRLPIVEFLQKNASESLTHAQQAGEIMTGLGGHPSMVIAEVAETHDHSVLALLRESHAHETKAVDLYRELLSEVEGRSVYLEEYARGMVAAEEAGAMEFRKMLRDFGD